MFAYQLHTVIPHVTVQMAGTVSMSDLDAVAFEGELQRLPDRFVMLLDHSELKGFEPEAVGVMIYLARRVFEADPGLVVAVNGGQTRDPELRAIVERLDKHGRLHVVATREQAQALLDTYCNPSRSEPQRDDIHE